MLWWFLLLVGGGGCLLLLLFVVAAVVSFWVFLSGSDFSLFFVVGQSVGRFVGWLGGRFALFSFAFSFTFFLA